MLNLINLKELVTKVIGFTFDSIVGFPFGRPEAEEGKQVSEVYVGTVGRIIVHVSQILEQ